MNDYWLETTGLCRYFKRGLHEVKALDNVSMGIKKGEFLAVVGASGSGKSTLLNLLAGLDTPTSGSVRVDNQILSELSRHELARYRATRIGMVFQSFNLLPHRTALQNVEIALYFNNSQSKKRRKQAGEILEQLGLGDRIDHRPPDLSGGEQQRVALARALVKNPEILLADEPTGNLDQENTDMIAGVLKDLNSRGLTIIMVTHDLELAGNYASRTLKMVYGKVADV